MKLATSPLKGKPRRMRVDREERLAFVRRLLTRPSESRAVNFFRIQSIIFLYANNAIKKAPCRHFFHEIHPSLTIRIALSTACLRPHPDLDFINFYLKTHLKPKSPMGVFKLYLRLVLLRAPAYRLRSMEI